jgi:radical SAM protein with 4Fe4S-binding SPASM domain
MKFPMLVNIKVIKVWLKIFTIKRWMNYHQQQKSIFSAVEIETINRCNGKCSFCPVNSKLDKRPFAKMNKILFCNIIDELSDLKYSGFLGLYSNNEPYLDRDIVDKIAYSRLKCQHAFIYLYTNGTLLTWDKLKSSIDAGISHIAIDNYSDEGLFHSNIVEIIQKLKEPNSCKYREKVSISIRRENEILTNRGGIAPNKSPEIFKDYNLYLNAGCLLPFRQFVIRPSGEVSLCCQDALGQMTLGDVNKNSLNDIWFGDQYKNVRNILMNIGRRGVSICKICDVSAVYRNDFILLLKNFIGWR